MSLDPDKFCLLSMFARTVRRWKGSLGSFQSTAALCLQYGACERGTRSFHVLILSKCFLMSEHAQESLRFRGIVMVRLFQNPIISQKITVSHSFIQYTWNGICLFKLLNSNIIFYSLWSAIQSMWLDVGLPMHCESLDGAVCTLWPHPGAITVVAFHDFLQMCPVSLQCSCKYLTLSGNPQEVFKRNLRESLGTDWDKGGR